jgi:hypothetical protein
MTGWQLAMHMYHVAPTPLALRAPEMVKEKRVSTYSMRDDIIDQLQGLDWIYTSELADMMGKHRSNVNDWIVRMPEVDTKTDERGIRMVRLK